MTIEVTSGYSDSNDAKDPDKDDGLSDVVDQTTEDATTYLNDDLAYQASKAKLAADLDTLDAMSAAGSDECFVYIITVIFPDMMDCTEMEIKMQTDAMNLGVDAKNLTLFSQDDYNAILAGETDTVDSSGNVTETAESKEEDDAAGMVNSLNLLLGTEPPCDEYSFTIDVKDASGNSLEGYPKTANGLLELLADPNDQGFWPGGLSPMSPTDMITISEAADGVISCIGQGLWDDASATEGADGTSVVEADDSDYDAIIEEMNSWLPVSDDATTGETSVETHEDGSTTTTTKNADGSVTTVEADAAGNQTSSSTTAVDDQTGNEEDTGNSAYSTTISSLDANYQKQQMYLQVLMNYYQETADSASTMMDDYNAQLTTYNQNLGS